MSTQPVPADAAAAPPWPADQVEHRLIERLISYANNSRRHSAVDLDKIAPSIRKWGWTMPVLADENGELIAGELRAAAGRKLGLPSIPVIVARGWTQDEKRAYRLADNQLAARASWDPEQLSQELGELKFAQFDLGLIGFEPDQLDKFLGGLDRMAGPIPTASRNCPISRLPGRAMCGCWETTGSAAATAPERATSRRC